MGILTVFRAPSRPIYAYYRQFPGAVYMGRRPGIMESITLTGRPFFLPRGRYNKNNVPGSRLIASLYSWEKGGGNNINRPILRPPTFQLPLEPFNSCPDIQGLSSRVAFLYAAWDFFNSFKSMFPPPTSPPLEKRRGPPPALAKLCRRASTSSRLIRPL